MRLAEPEESLACGERGMRSLHIGTMFSLAMLFGPIVSARSEEIDFSRDVRPILARHCFKCHGPDDKARKAKLRLDVREAAMRGGKSGQPAIVPANPEEGEMVRRIFASEETDVMPPPAAKNPLPER